MQLYKMLLWRKPEEKEASFEEIAKRAYDTVNLFCSLPVEYRPRYLANQCLRTAVEFDWSYGGFSAALKKGVNKEPFTGCIFEDLGYGINFFSSKKDSLSFEYDISVGIKSGKFKNVIMINIPIQFNMIDSHNSDIIAKLFEEAIDKFEPQWGCIVNQSIRRKEAFKIDPRNRTTKEVYWMTYWSDEYASIVGKRKLESIPTAFPDAEYHNGLLRLRKQAFDVDNEADIEYLLNVRRYLFGEASDIRN